MEGQRPALRPLPQVGTHKHIVLAQHGHLPQGLVGESVEVVRTALPPAPALLPACMYQLLCKQEYNPDRQGCAQHPCYLTRPHHSLQYLGGPVLGELALENRAGSDWRCLESDLEGMLPPGGCRDSHWPSQQPLGTCHTEDQECQHHPTHQLQLRALATYLQI